MGGRRPCWNPATRSSTAATPTTRTTSGARGVLETRGIHFLDVGDSGGVFGLERGYCLMIGGEAEAFARLEPIFATLAPGSRPRRAHSTQRSPTAEEQGYLHCGGTARGTS